MVIQGAFVIAHIARIRVGQVQQPRELEHIVGIAGFRPLHVLDHRGEVFAAVEVLAHAVAADGDGALLHHFGPEVFRGVPPGFIAGELANALVADHLRDLRVGVQAGQFVFMFFQRLQDGLVGQAAGDLQVFVVASDLRHIGIDLVQAAVLAAQYVLDLHVAELAEQARTPVGKLHQHGFCLLAASVAVGVAQPGEELVDVIEWYPFLVQREQVCADFAGGDLLPHLGAAGNAADITVAVGFLRAL